VEDADEDRDPEQRDEPADARREPTTRMTNHVVPMRTLRRR
jgi:hypothetical protein